MKISGMDYGRPRRAFQIARYARQVFCELKSSFLLFFFFLLKVQVHYSSALSQSLYLYTFLLDKFDFDIILQRKVFKKWNKIKKENILVDNNKSFYCEIIIRICNLSGNIYKVLIYGDLWRIDFRS